MCIRTLIVTLICSAAASIIPAQSPRSAALRQRASESQPSGVFVPAESAALFVGVREFDANVPKVPYAADDAVDLAYAVAFERPTPLVPPDRIVLALAGKPQKRDSKQHLEDLSAQGTVVVEATHLNLLTAAENQAGKVGPNGVLIVGIATHGGVDDRKRGYLYAKDSNVAYPETVVSVDRLLQLAAPRNVRRSLILFDTCRTNLPPIGERSVTRNDVGSPALFLKGVAQVSGRVILNAAPNGRPAYDDMARQNGVFTEAVIEGLQCRAEPDARGLITVHSLASYVYTRVESWITDHHGAEEAHGIEILADASTEMPLAQCRAPQVIASPALPEILQQVSAVAHNAAETAPANAQLAANTFSVYNVANDRLWSKKVKGRVVQVEIADLDADGEQEVIAGIAGKGDDAGKILVYDARGHLKWTADTTAPFNYDDARAGRLVVEKFIIGDLFRRKTQQVVVLSNDSQGFYPSRVTIFDKDGSLLSSYWHPGRLLDVAIGAAGPHADVCIVVSAVNYPLRKTLSPRPIGAVFVLDPRAVAGEAPPYHGKSKRGTHLWYGIVRPAGALMGALEIADFHHVGSNEISLRVSAYEVFYLSFAGELKGDQSEGRDGPSPLFNLLQ